MKDLKKDSFRVKVAYYFTKDSEIPTQVNICVLFWRFVSNLLFCIPVGWVVWIAFEVLGSVSAFMVGWRLKTEAELSIDDSDSFTRCHRWPEVLGFRVTVANVAILMAAITALALSGRALFRTIVSLPHWSIGAALAILGIFLLILFQKKTGALSLIWAYLKAKKQKVCPIITIVDGPVSS